MDPVNPGMPGGGMPPPPPSMGGPMGGPVSPGQGGPVDDPHDKIMEALNRIEDKLAQIAAKLGA
ncbi:MAG: hypothetical protein A3H50_03000 [Candidatus Levybacteria bacterium RIFCSPLOWO2_02_FULL_37_10]|nr:MAG: hypothetical protein A2860_02565 [Candidatus Levybacteria bacterium RIFCSPHIGHO2_01_FULL_37_33]OGH15594.1 MAG: hypothetical protein A3C97_01245 [Candidatus Levybacteria bacterium RIFCSPHIGHO2_02_FULL_37_11]OGH29698.1 MAG: hypothetical protein A3F30_02970 [Candidatus Levybacteria bacterium RIFCSPHIGHO2_12_FULL_37_12]OGH45793.1 MAG: hypothetical protein A3H50_03000 [Candidatus Levybacteria bacterium RIFCSPLOWO2_02_FULL_37_10]